MRLPDLGLVRGFGQNRRQFLVAFLEPMYKGGRYRGIIGGFPGVEPLLSFGSNFKIAFVVRVERGFVSRPQAVGGPAVGAAQVGQKHGQVPTGATWNRRDRRLRVGPDRFDDFLGVFFKRFNKKSSGSHFPHSNTK